MVAGRPRVRKELRILFFRGLRAGLTTEEAAGMSGVSGVTGNSWRVEAGGVIPSLIEPSGLRLSFAEREDIAMLTAKGDGVRAIATQLGRSPSTISRELERNTLAPKVGYRATTAQDAAEKRARRPQPSKLATNEPLREYVQQKLDKKFSPEQIANRLPVDHPENEQMRVSHETIYLSLYVQGRGALSRELTKHLRTGRSLRKHHGTPAHRRGRIIDMVSIADRPPEVEDRAVPGHWEGDLIVGKASQSAIGTLVERMTRFVLLLHLPDGHSAVHVQNAMVKAMSRLPETLRRTLTWDQGREMANHAQIAAATDLDIYFCDPRSPWQRGTNENTNGLLRQYFPKNSDLSGYHPDYLEFVAAELNNRPRKTLTWRTPAETLDELLSNPNRPLDVAMTA